ncbi:MAG TPA: hemolysin family protein [Candidatus Binataceae bacterium]|nr:hemolysin family protein [Candidatus Binataceae bacterium]
MHLALLVAAIVLCVMAQAFFAASEIALVTADEVKVYAEEAQGKRSARILSGLLHKRDRMVALLLTGNNLATVIAAATLTSFLHDLGPHKSLAAPFILAPASLLLGESIPKMLAMRTPLAFARFAARPLALVAGLLAPLLIAETALSRTLRRLAGVSPESEDAFLTREDLALLVRRRDPEGSSATTTSDGEIMPAERQMIWRILRFTHTEARQAMVPLVRVEAVPEETTVAGVIEVVRREGYTRIPVFHKRVFDIVGIVHAFDLLEAPDRSRPVSEIVRPVSYFPESTPIDEILVALQRTRESLAVVVDEYGGAAGILTMEDLLEEVVGDIADEHDVDEEVVRVVNPRTLAVSAHAGIAELNERFGLQLPESPEYATIAGLVVERLGHIPKPGEQLKAGDATISVARSDARAVREVTLHLSRPLRPEQSRRR